MNLPDWGVSYTFRQYVYYHANNMHTSGIPPKDEIPSMALSAGQVARCCPITNTTPDIHQRSQIPSPHSTHNCPSKCQASDGGDSSPRPPPSYNFLSTFISNRGGKSKALTNMRQKFPTNQIRKMV